MRIVVDSYAWVELFIGSMKGEQVRKIMLEAESILTPDITLAELARKFLREGLDEHIINNRLRLIEEISDVIPIDSKIALEAARQYKRLWKKAKIEHLKDPSLFDAIILATAIVNEAKLLTGDKHFKGLEETIWIDD